jgi:hypothetical protein
VPGLFHRTSSVPVGQLAQTNSVPVRYKQLVLLPAPRHPTGPAPSLIPFTSRVVPGARFAPPYQLRPCGSVSPVELRLSPGGLRPRGYHRGQTDPIRLRSSHPSGRGSLIVVPMPGLLHQASSVPVDQLDQSSSVSSHPSGG